MNNKRNIYREILSGIKDINKWKQGKINLKVTIISIVKKTPVTQGKKDDQNI